MNTGKKNKRYCRIGLLIFGFTLMIFSPLPGQDWLQWGGPNSDYTVNGKNHIDKWGPEGPKVLWKRPLGEGYSTILCKNGKLYTFYSTGGKEIVAALDAKTGKTIWEHAYDQKFWDDMRKGYGPGPNASMAIAGDRIISTGISGNMRCLKLKSGKLIWKRDLPTEYGRYKRVEEYGYSGSPILFGDKILVQAGGEKISVIALNPKDGSTIWECGPGGNSYAQASILKLAGIKQLIFFTPQGVNGLDLETGQFLWHHTIPIGNGNHLTPVVQCDTDLVYVASQFSKGGGRLLKIIREDKQVRVNQIWFKSELCASCWTLIRIGDLIYGPSGSHFKSPFTAFNWKTGEIIWKQKGYRMAQTLKADNKFIILDERGNLSLASVSKTGINVLSTSKVTGRVSWTLPTLVSDKLYIRDRKNILAIDLGKN